jgi:hypothetical protein
MAIDKYYKKDISIKKLVELLNTCPEHYRVNVNPVGNINVYEPFDEGESNPGYKYKSFLAWIDLAEEEINHAI